MCPSLPTIDTPFCDAVRDGTSQNSKHLQMEVDDEPDEFASFRSPTSAWKHSSSPVEERMKSASSISPLNVKPTVHSPMSPAKRQFTGRIVGEGSLGLSVNIKHEGRTGKIKGIQLGNISGAALVIEPVRFVCTCEVSVNTV